VYFVRTDAHAPGFQWSADNVTIADTFENIETMTKTIKVKNTGQGDLSWKVFGLPTWMHVSPMQGTTAPGQETPLTLTFGADELSPGGTFQTNLSLLTNLATGSAGVRRLQVSAQVSFEQ
jgi:hypothetical protein